MGWEADIADAGLNFDDLVRKPDAPAASSLFGDAQKQYPVLQKLNLNYKYNPTPNRGFLEFWPSDEPGSDDYRRPNEFPLGKPGLEVFDPNTKPIDIMGDVASHYLRDNDPKVKGYYDNFINSMSGKQNAILQDQYDYAKKNEGETRPFEQWRESVGLPAYFRGYAFKQWPEEFNAKAYSPEQRRSFDEMMRYLQGQDQSVPPGENSAEAIAGSQAYSPFGAFAPTAGRGVPQTFPTELRAWTPEERARLDAQKPAIGKTDLGGERPSFFGVGAEAGKRGLVEGLTETARAGTAFQDRQNDWLANQPQNEVSQLLSQPFSEGWKDPRWWMAAISHGTAASSPSLAAGVAGATGGGAVGGPVGALAGGAAGFGLGSMIQTLAPAYQRARAQGLDHEAAVDRAITESGISGVTGAAMGLAPAVRLFGTTAEGAIKRPISEALAQIFGVQPGIGIAGTVASRAATGQELPTADELATQYATQVGTGAVLTGMQAGARSAPKWWEIARDRWLKSQEPEIPVTPLSRAESLPAQRFGPGEIDFGDLIPDRTRLAAPNKRIEAQPEEPAPSAGGEPPSPTPMTPGGPGQPPVPGRPVTPEVLPAQGRQTLPEITVEAASVPPALRRSVINETLQQMQATPQVAGLMRAEQQRTGETPVQVIERLSMGPLADQFAQTANELALTGKTSRSAKPLVDALSRELAKPVETRETFQAPTDAMSLRAKAVEPTRAVPFSAKGAAQPLSAPEAVQARPSFGTGDILAAIGAPMPAAAPQKDELGYYSKALESAKALKQETGTPQQMLAQLRTAGVKESEINATALDTFMKGKAAATGKVSKQEIVEFLDKNRVKLKEGRYFGDTPEIADARVIRAAMRNGTKPWDENEYHRLGDMISEFDRGRNQPKWRDYSLDPDNPTYRENVLHLGPSGRERENAKYLADTEEKYHGLLETRRKLFTSYPRPADFDAQIASIDAQIAPLDEERKARHADQNALAGAIFKSGHWDEPNIVAHTRTAEYQDTKGHKVFNIDELQSDWGQKIREGGIRDDAKIAGLEEQKAVANQAFDAHRVQGDEIFQKAVTTAFEATGETLPGDVIEHSSKLKRGEAAGFSTNSRVMALNSIASFLEDRAGNKTFSAPIKTWINENARLAAENRRIQAELGTAKAETPGHPLVNTTDQWVTTAMRRLIQQAVDTGADGISITPGKVQAARFDLIRHGIDGVAYVPEGGMIFTNRNGRWQQDASGTAPESLAAYMGGELADKLLKTEPEDSEFGYYAHVIGDLNSISLGGEGMKATYDNIYPRILGKLLQKLDPSIKAEKTKLLMHGDAEPPSGGRYAMSPQFNEDFTFFPLTEKAKAKLAEEGQPMFALGGKQTETEAFKRWFGDSKVVDGSGEPLVVYHGTLKAGFDRFDRGMDNRNSGTGATGLYFTNHKLGAGTYSGTRKAALVSSDPEFDIRYDGEPGNYAVYLSMQKPLVVDFQGGGWDDAPEDSGFGGQTINDISDYAETAGFDGVIAKNISDEGGYGQGYGWGDTTYIAFKPTQVKSATQNRGTFDPNDERISYATAQKSDGRKGADALLKMGRSVDLKHADDVLDQASAVDAIVPEGTPYGALAKITPIKGKKGHVTATFKLNSGEELNLPFSWEVLASTRAFFRPLTEGRSGGLFLARLDPPAQSDKRLVGEVRHESIHALRHVGNLVGPDWDSLVSHAKNLRVLETDLRTFLQAIGNPTYKDAAPGVTTLELYEELYKDRKDPQEKIDQEYVAHMAELYSHGIFLPQEIGQVKSLLDGIFSGEFSQKTTAEPKKELEDVAAFAGPWAKTAKETPLILAKKLAEMGRDREGIWQKTGWFQGADGKWRFEIDDSTASLRTNPDALMRASTATAESETKLGKLLKHPALFEAYPHLKNLHIYLDPGSPFSEGGHRRRTSNYDAGLPHQQYIVLGLKGYQPTPRANAVLLSTLMHEVQHEIQDQENFATGGSPKNFQEDFVNRISLNELTPLDEKILASPEVAPTHEQWLHAVRGMAKAANDPKKRADLRELSTFMLDRLSKMVAFGHYRRLGGEVEAREVQQRMPMGEQSRRETWPMPVPAEEQNIRFPYDDGRYSDVSLSVGRSRKYPMAPRDRWYGEGTYEVAGGRMTEMTPEEYLAQTRPMPMDDLTRENVDDLKQHILSGGELDPLALYADGREDGRHRAHAAKELGIKTVPVINYRKENKPQDAVGRISYALAGQRALGAPKEAMQAAEGMEARGRDPQAIWQATGIGRGIEGKQRWEIDDSGAKIIGLDKAFSTPKKGGFLSRLLGRAPAPKPGIREANNVPLLNVLHHPKLFNAYPFLRQMRVDLAYGDAAFQEGALISRKKDGKRIYKPIQASGSTPQELLEVLMHEIQHYIQDREGFARGSDYQGGGMLDKFSERGGALYDPGRDLSEEERNSFRHTARDATLLKTTRPEWLALQIIKAYERLDQADTPREREMEQQEIGELGRRLEESMLVRGGDYGDSYGEHEAETVANRLAMTPEERRANPPMVDLPKALRDTSVQTRDYAKAYDEVMRRAQVFKQIEEKWKERKDLGKGVSVVRPEEDMLIYTHGPNEGLIEARLYPTASAASVSFLDEFFDRPYHEQKNIMDIAMRDLRGRNVRPQISDGSDDQDVAFWGRYDPRQVAFEPRFYKQEIAALARDHYGKDARVTIYDDGDVVVTTPEMQRKYEAYREKRDKNNQAFNDFHGKMVEKYGSVNDMLQKGDSQESQKYSDLARKADDFGPKPEEKAERYLDLSPIFGDRNYRSGAPEGVDRDLWRDMLIDEQLAHMEKLPKPGDEFDFSDLVAAQ